MKFFTKNVLFLVLVVFLLLLVTGVVVVKEAFEKREQKEQVCYTNGPDSVYTTNPKRRPNSYLCSNVNCKRRTEQECSSFSDASGCCNTTRDGF